MDGGFARDTQGRSTPLEKVDEDGKLRIRPPKGIGPCRPATGFGPCSPAKGIDVVTPALVLVEFGEHEREMGLVFPGNQQQIDVIKDAVPVPGAAAKCLRVYGVDGSMKGKVDAHQELDGDVDAGEKIGAEDNQSPCRSRSNP